jgi:mannonate dehydratase
MGADVPGMIRHFGGQGKIFFAHFRNVRGTAEKFHETFHNDGDTDMYAAIRAYYEIGFEGPIRPDHAPTLAGDSNAAPGYGLMGKLQAVGYMQGLMEAIEKSHQVWLNKR